MLRKIKFFLFHLYTDLKWSPFNPWCIGRMNLAYKRYTESDLYKYRVDALGHKFAHDHYHETRGAETFITFFTFKDKLKVLLTPFSCGNEYSIPFDKILGNYGRDTKYM